MSTRLVTALPAIKLQWFNCISSDLQLEAQQQVQAKLAKL